MAKAFGVVPSMQSLPVGPGNQTDLVYLYSVPKGHKITTKIQREAAGGLILNTKREVVSLGIPYAPHIANNIARINWRDAWAEPTYPGTDFVVYNYKDKTFIQTKDIVDLESDDGDSASVLYRDVRTALGGTDFGDIDSGNNYCWVFKYLDKAFDTRVHKVDAGEAILLCAYSKEFNRPITRENVSRFAAMSGFETPACLLVKSKTEALGLRHRPRTRKCPGFTIVDYAGNRASLPNNRKDSLGRILAVREELVPNHIAELVLKEDTEHIIRSYPEYATCVKLVRGILMRVMDDLDDKWIALSGKYENRAEFASMARQDPLRCILFSLWTGKVRNFADATAMIKPSHLMSEVMLREQRRFMTAFADLKINLK